MQITSKFPTSFGYVPILVHMNTIYSPSTSILIPTENHEYIFFSFFKYIKNDEICLYKLHVPFLVPFTLLLMHLFTAYSMISFLDDQWFHQARLAFTFTYSEAYFTVLRKVLETVSVLIWNPHNQFLFIFQCLLGTFYEVLLQVLYKQIWERTWGLPSRSL